MRADLERVTAAEARGQIQYAVPGSPWLKAIAAGLWIWRYREADRGRDGRGRGPAGPGLVDGPAPEAGAGATGRE